MNKNILLTLSAALLTTVGLVTAPVALSDNLEESKQLFLSDAQPMAYTICQTLQNDASTSISGPDLDDLRTEADRIHKVLIEGMGAMLTFGLCLSQEQHDAIVDYVVSATN